MKAKKISKNLKQIVVECQSKELCDEELMAVTGGISCIGKPTNNKPYSNGCYGSRINL